MDLREKKAEISQPKQKLLKKIEFSEKLEKSWWRDSTNVRVVQVREKDPEEDEIAVKETFSLRRGVPSI